MQERGAALVHLCVAPAVGRMCACRRRRPTPPKPAAAAAGLCPPTRPRRAAVLLLGRRPPPPTVHHLQAHAHSHTRTLLRRSPAGRPPMHAGMNTSELMTMGRKQIKETDTSLLRSEKIVNDTMAIGIQTAETLQGQTRQLEKVRARRRMEGGRERGMGKVEGCGQGEVGPTGEAAVRHRGALQLAPPARSPSSLAPVAAGGCLSLPGRAPSGVTRAALPRAPPLPPPLHPSHAHAPLPPCTSPPPPHPLPLTHPDRRRRRCWTTSTRSTSR